MSEHKSHKVIQAEIKRASERIKLGATYLHYKNRNPYQPINFATREADDELQVIYQAQYGDKLYFLRPVREWLEEVAYEGKNVPRFVEQ